MQKQDIIDMLLQQDPQGVSELLTHYGPLMQYVLRPILPNEQDREECLSEVALRVATKISLYDPSRGSWTGWLTSVTRSVALNYKRRAEHKVVFEELTPDIPSSAPSPEERLLQNERRLELQNAISQLSALDRLVFYRKYYYLQTTTQIASELGMTNKAIEGRLYRIRKHLQALLGGERNA